MRNIWLFIGVGLLWLGGETVAPAQERPTDKAARTAKKAERLKAKDEGERRPGGAPSSFEVQMFKASNGQTLRYSLFTPKDVDSKVKLPLVLCLHGAGGNTAAAAVLAQPHRQKKHPCFILAPACDSKGSRWALTTFRASKDQRSVEPELMETLDAVIKSHTIDPDRVYITGQSMGGVGTWGLIAAHADRFAAAVPVCGIWETKDAAKIAKLPLWAFHGAEDNAVPVAGSRDMIEAMKKAGGSPRYTEYPGVGHGSWEAAYATDEIWDWMFQQRRASSSNQQ